MTMTEPIADPQFGIANWQDFVNNWRQKDAAYIQARTIPRFANTGTRDTAIPSPSPGQFVYDQNVDYLEMRSKNNTWLTYRPLPQNLAVVLDDNTGVTLAHATAAGKGLVLAPSLISISGNLNVLGGVLTADPTGVSIKVGARTAKLSTDASNLVSDSPISAPSLVLTGTGTVISAAGKTMALGTLTADTVNVTTLGLAGTLTGGVINGTSGTIGGVGHAGNVATASGGFQVVANGGRLYGDANNAYVRVGGGGSYVAVTTGGISFNGGVTDFNNTARLLGNNVLQYYYNGNSQAANVAPSLYSGGDPGAGNFPDGTIWIN